MKINWLNCWTVGSVVLLVGSEILALAGAAAWALTGLLDLSGPLATGVTAAALLAALGATAAFAREANRVEPVWAGHPVVAPPAGPALTPQA